MKSSEAGNRRKNKRLIQDETGKIEMSQIIYDLKKCKLL